MDKTELRKLAIKKLNSKGVKNFKKQLCQHFTGKEKEDCINAFNKNFVKSFMKTAQNNLSI